MIIFPDPKIAFLHIKKTGGTSTKYFLKDLFPNFVYYNNKTEHESLQEPIEYINKLGICLDNYDIISNIRNPYSHIVSLYFFYNQASNVSPNRLSMSFAREHTFEEFVEYWCKSKDIHDRSFGELLTIDGQTPKNLTILKLESINDDLSSFLSSKGLNIDVKLKSVNTSIHDAPENYFSKNLFHLVEEKYKWCFENRFYAYA